MKKLKRAHIVLSFVIALLIVFSAYALIPYAANMTARASGPPAAVQKEATS